MDWPFTAPRYIRSTPLQTQIETLHSQLEHESSEKPSRILYDRLKIFGLRLQGEAPFKQALAAGDQRGAGILDGAKLYAVPGSARTVQV